MAPSERLKSSLERRTKSRSPLWKVIHVILLSGGPYAFQLDVSPATVPIPIPSCHIHVVPQYSPRGQDPTPGGPYPMRSFTQLLS